MALKLFEPKSSETFEASSKAVQGERILSHEPLMRSVVRRFFDSHADQDDAMQDAAIALIQAEHKFEDRSEFCTWVYRVTCNACLMRLRATRRRARREQACASPDSERVARQEGILESMVRQESVRIVTKAIDTLPRDYREILTLRAVNLLSVADCAERLGLSEDAVRARCTRARRRLGEKLAILDA